MSIDDQVNSALNLRHVASLWALLLIVQPFFFTNSDLNAAEPETIETQSAVPPGFASRHDYMLLEANRQLQSQEFADVEANMRAYIKQIEAQDSRYALNLATPLLMLGTAMELQDDIIGALEMYGRALHIQRVNQGLHTINQVTAVYKEANALVSIGDVIKANEKQEYAYNILRRSLGPLNIELLPGLYHLAEWYKKTNNIYSARGLYEHAKMLIVEDSSETDTRLLKVYSGLADSYKLERFPPYHSAQSRNKGAFRISSNSTNSPLALQEQPKVHRYSEGEQALQQIIRIMKASPDFNSGDTARAVVDLADWNLLFDKPKRAGVLYRHSIDLINTAPEENRGMYAELFSDPVQLYMPLPLDPKAPENATKQQALNGTVEISYAIDARGHTRTVETLLSDPAGMMDIKVRRAVKMARFRPRLEDSLPVRTEDRFLKYEFTYYPAKPRNNARLKRAAAIDTAPETDTDAEPSPE